MSERILSLLLSGCSELTASVLPIIVGSIVVSNYFLRSMIKTARVFSEYRVQKARDELEIRRLKMSDLREETEFDTDRRIKSNREIFSFTDCEECKDITTAINYTISYNLNHDVCESVLETFAEYGVIDSSLFTM